jgi:hypothetical protein
MLTSLVDAWDQALPFSSLLCSLLQLHFLFVFIDLILVGGEASHRNHQISEGALKLFPVVQVVEELDYVLFDFYFVQVGKFL